MKKLITLFSLVLMTISVSAQSVRGDLNGDGQVTTTDVTEMYNIIFGTAAAPERNMYFGTVTAPEGKMDFNVNGVTFKMVKVDGGTFQMGATSEQGSDASTNESPVHSVTLSDYWIGETEVTQALWEAVMGSNPSYFEGSNRPVEQVSWEDCQEFVNKLNSLLSGQLPAGHKFRLPTEAEWEFAARGGNNATSQTKYAGSDNINDVAWWAYNSDYMTHDVATKAPNALGIYDMSGNVYECCQDWFDSSYYSSSPQTNPTGPSSGSYRVDRGGGWNGNAGDCSVSYRGGSTPSRGCSYIGLRVALSEPAQSVRGDLNGDGEINTSDVTELYNIIFGTAAAQEANMNYNVNGVTFKMVKVDGGTFEMGATPEQGIDAWINEKPKHSVTLSDYWIGETEVTQALWEAVMGSNPSYFSGSNRPVEKVTWNDCQTFVNKLNSLLSGQLPSGRKFRLPTEAEWEYAARGGNRSGHYKYSGSNDIWSVAWYKKNSYDLGEGHPEFGTHDVKTKNSNELDIYDMTGNVDEWCQDNYRETYNASYDTSLRVVRGGRWSDFAKDCRVSCRDGHDPAYWFYALGMRLAL